MTALTPTHLFRTLAVAGAPFSGGAAGDLASLAAVKGELNITTTASDAWLASAISARSRAVTRYLNRDIPVQTYEEQFWERREFYTRLWRDRSVHAPLQLERWPIANVPSPAGTAPPLTPTISAVAGGALPARTYFVKISYLTAKGETAPSIEASVALAADTLLQVSTPGADTLGLATGWAVYAGASSWAETRQASLGLAQIFTEPTSGLVAGAALPNYALVIENYPTPVVGSPFAPAALTEGVDFLVDADTGQLSRLYLSGYTRPWPYFPVTIQYAAGFATIPDDIQEAVGRLVAMRYFERGRDKALRSENVAGVYSANYVAGAGALAMPPDIAADLDAYRVPLIG